MNEQDLLNAKRGKNPFKVPEGYFEHFTERMMEQIPTQHAPNFHEEEKPAIKHVSLFTRVKPYLYLAATFGGLYFGIQVFHYHAEKIKQEKAGLTAQQTTTQSGSHTYVDDVFDYVGVDHADVYAYATSPAFDND